MKIWRNCWADGTPRCGLCTMIWWDAILLAVCWALRIVIFLWLGWVV